MQRFIKNVLLFLFPVAVFFCSLTPFYIWAEKTGEVVGLIVVNSNQELLLITTEGIVIRTDVSDISVIGRHTQGVKLIKVNEGDKVAALATI